MLAVLGGNAAPGADDVKKILSSVGAEVDDDSLKRVMGELAGKDVYEVIEAGKEKLASVPSGGGAVAAAGGAAGGAAAAEAPKAESEKEDSEEEDMDMGFDLFD